MHEPKARSLSRKEEEPKMINVNVEKLRGAPVVYQHDGGRSLGPPFRRQLHRGPRPRPLPWPDRIIGPPRRGDHRTPVERWIDFHFEWEQHFYG